MVQIAGLVAGGLLLASPLAASAGGAAPRTVKEVDANGNPLTGGLSFDPSAVRVPVGGTVRWTNTDFFVPHTATEDHMLWRLTGDYGDPLGLFPTGFAPGESRERRFAAGTWSYYCEVHPEPMRGTATVPVTLRRVSRGVRAIWSAEPLPARQVFDVQRRRGADRWQTVRRGVRALGARFGGRGGTTLSFRARVRSTSDPAARSGYSPPARIRLR